jgi:hypothetical protein
MERNRCQRRGGEHEASSSPTGNPGHPISSDGSERQLNGGACSAAYGTGYSLGKQRRYKFIMTIFTPFSPFCLIYRHNEEAEIFA